MFKKIISLGVMLVMLFAVLGCDPQVNELAEYKAAKKAELTEYVGDFDEDHYTVKNWELIEKAVEDGKTAIDVAIDTDSVDVALITAKEEIMAVTSKLDTELAEYKAAKKAELTDYPAEFNKDDYSDINWELLQNAAENGKAAVDAATDKAQVDAAANAAKEAIAAVLKKCCEMHEQIRQDWLEKLNISYLSLDDIYIDRCYGIYNGSVAVIMAIYGYDPPPSIDEIEVAGFKFLFSAPILIWRTGIFYNLQDAYDQSFLTTNNIKTIHSFTVKLDCGSVAIKATDSYSEYPAVVEEMIVAGVVFIYSGPSVIIWREIKI